MTRQSPSKARELEQDQPQSRLARLWPTAGVKKLAHGAATQLERRAIDPVVLLIIALGFSLVLQVALGLLPDVPPPIWARIGINLALGTILFLSWLRDRSWQNMVGLAIVFLATAFIVAQLAPSWVFRAPATPYGGDNSNHAIAPAFLRDYLLPRFRLFGWSPDWYDGWPIYQFYFPFPNFFIAFGGFFIHYGVAFKIVVLISAVGLPASVYYFAKRTLLPHPGPAILAVATLPFLFDQKNIIYGGNILGVLVGEYSFSISLCMGFLFLGSFAEGLRTGKHRARTAFFLACTGLSHIIPTLFVVIAALILLLLQIDRGRVRYAISTFIPGGLMAAFWALPFQSKLHLTSDFGYGKVPDYRAMLLPFTARCPETGCAGYQWEYFKTYQLRLFLIMAIIAVLVGLLRRRRITLMLTLWCAFCAWAFIAVPQGKLWTPRIIPFYDLAIHLLAGLCIYEACYVLQRLAVRAPDLFRRGYSHVPRPIGKRHARRALAEGQSSQSTPGQYGLLTLTATRTLAVVFPVVTLMYSTWFVARPLDSVPNWVYDVRVPFTNVHPFQKLPVDWASPVKGWSQGNFQGYENQPGWPAYQVAVKGMQSIAEQYGCGRVFIETGDDGSGYGGSTALWMLPHWTDRCLQSIEGMYFESSGTTAYWFLAETSVVKQDTKTFYNLPYPTQRNFPVGVQQMQMLGAKYLMAYSDVVNQDAKADPTLKEVGKAGNWTVYTVADTDLVVPLSNLPARLPSLEVHSWKDYIIPWSPKSQLAESWLDVVAPWFADPTRYPVLLAEEGPKDWPSVEITRDPALRTPTYGSGVTVSPPQEVPIEPTAVSNIKTGVDWASFDVAEVGKPVLVKISYFPNWKAHGAKGPYRVSPNFMVVIPTSTHVELHYETTIYDRAGWALTLVGFVMLAALAINPRLRLKAGKDEEPIRPDTPLFDPNWDSSVADIDIAISQARRQQRSALIAARALELERTGESTEGDDASELGTER